MSENTFKKSHFFFRHNDLPWNIRKFIHNKLNTVNFTSSLKTENPWGTSQWSHTDLTRLKQGQVGGQVSLLSKAKMHFIILTSLLFLQLWVAYAPCGSQHKDAVQVTLEQIDLIKRFINQYPNHLRFVNDSAGNHLLPLEGPTWRWRVSEKKERSPREFCYWRASLVVLLCF